MTPSDLVAIMTFSSDVKVVQDFTDDRDLLTKDIKNMAVGEGQGFDVARAATTAPPTPARHSRRTIPNSTSSIPTASCRRSKPPCSMLGALNEKKALVYFASGMSAQLASDNEAQLRATVNAAIRANTAFYPVDARGLVATAPLGDATKGSPGGSGMYTGSSGRAAQSNFQGQQETLYTLAADTGGKALLDNNDLSMGIQQAQKDISSYYIIGYYSQQRQAGRAVPQGGYQAAARASPPSMRRSITATATSPARISEVHLLRQGAPAYRGADAARPGDRHRTSRRKSIISAWRATATSFRSR